MPDFASVTDLLHPDPHCPPVRRDTLLIAVMHYERGDHLRLLMESIERNAPGVRVVVIDDGSTDPEAVGQLTAITRHHLVLVNRGNNDSLYLRGLHTNMNVALDHAAREGIPYVFFVQDDQQIVRPLDERFFAEVSGLFRCSGAISQVVPMFFKGFLATRLLAERFGVERERGFYYEKRSSYGVSDIGIVSVPRLDAHAFRFAMDEGGSGAAAAQLGLRIVFNRNPVLMYTPWPRTMRDSPNAVQAFGLGVNPYAYMSDEDIAALLGRPVEAFPIAENHLRTNAPVRRPWWYTAVNPRSMAEYEDFLRLKAADGEL